MIIQNIILNYEQKKFNVFGFKEPQIFSCVRIT